MKLEKLIVQGFGSIRDQVSLPLRDQGLTLILGRNEDAPRAASNGAGKSLLLDALAWGLWGKTVRGVNHDAVVNDSTGENCLVTVEATEGDDSYVFIRTRKATEGKPNRLEVYRNGEDLAKESIAETQVLVDSLLGYSFDVFCAAMPGAGMNITELTDKQIKELLERVLMTDILGSAHKTATTDLKGVRASLQDVEGRILVISTTTAGLNRQHAGALEAEAKFEESRTIEVKSLKEKIEAVEAALAKAVLVVEEGDKAVERVQTLSGHISKLNRELAGLWNQEGTIKAEYGKKRSGVAQARHTLKSKQEDIRGTIKRLDKLSGCECPECLQVVSEEQTLHIIEMLKEKVLSIDKELKDLSINEIALADQEAGALGPVETAIRTMLDLSKRAELEMVGLREKVGVAEQERVKVAVQTSTRASLVSTLEKVKTQKSPFQESLKDIEAQVEDVQVQESLAIGEKESLEEEAGRLQFWVDAFSQKGIRSYMLESVVPMLNASAEKYCQILTDGEMSVEFIARSDNEKFEVKVTHKHGGSSYRASSKGEQARANLVASFAIGDLAASRSHKPLSLRFLDEPFESVDEAGIEAIVQLLNEQSSEFDTVFVVTHQQSLQQMFNKSITAVKRNGETTLETQ